MKDKTIRRLIEALEEELRELMLKPQYRLMTDDPTCTIGEWCRRDQAFKAFGLSPHRLKQLVIEKKVCAKKMDPTEPTSVIVFRTADIRRAIDALPDYHYETQPNENDNEGED